MAENGDLDQPRYICGHCDRTFVFEKIMNMHKDAMHSEILENKSLNKNKRRLPFVYKKRETMSCNYSNCLETRKHSKSLEKHIRAAHSEIETSKMCPHCGKTIAVKSLERHIINVHTGEIQLCSKCHYSTNRIDSLKKHFRARHTSCNQSCDFCGKIVKDLIRHLRATMCGKDVDDRNVVPCPKCPVINRSLSQLRTHIIKFMKELRINTATSVPTQPTAHIT